MPSTPSPTLATKSAIDNSEVPLSRRRSRIQSYSEGKKVAASAWSRLYYIFFTLMRTDLSECNLRKFSSEIIPNLRIQPPLITTAAGCVSPKRPGAMRDGCICRLNYCLRSHWRKFTMVNGTASVTPNFEFIMVNLILVSCPGNGS